MCGSLFTSAARIIHTIGENEVCWMWLVQREEEEEVKEGEDKEFVCAIEATDVVLGGLPSSEEDEKPYEDVEEMPKEGEKAALDI